MGAMEAFAPNLREMRRTPLHDEHVAMIREHGTERVYEQGQMVVEAGDRMDEFIYCEEGELEMVDPRSDGRLGEFTLGPTQFLGELSFLNGGAWGMPIRAVQRSRCTVVPRTIMLDLMARVPEMSDIIVDVFAGRRRVGFEDQFSTVTIIGIDESLELRQVASFASRNKPPIHYVDLDSDEARTLCR